jgi:hypothetical protein
MLDSQLHSLPPPIWQQQANERTAAYTVEHIRHTFTYYIGAATAAGVLEAVQLLAGVGDAGSVFRRVAAAPARRTGAVLNVIDMQTDQNVVAVVATHREQHDATAASMQDIF